MEKLVVVERDGENRNLFGIPVCEGPGAVRLVVTRPYHEAGRIIEIPLDDVESIDDLPPHSPLGEAPRPSS
jgi:hypothetical protein